MLELTVARAQLQDGQTILDLGCGWGALSLFLAQRFPSARITAVSNSRTQKEFIDRCAAEQGLTNIRADVRDITGFSPESSVDRIVSVEMLEHVRNHEELFARMASWLKPEGLVFIHVFSHLRFVYPFEATGPTDWMARHFFTGGLMPADSLFLYHQKDLALLDHWHVDGTHYQKTLEAWLRNMDRQKQVIMPILARTYGQEDAGKWWVRWRVFFMACAELFGTNRGREWIVSHYLLTRNPHLSDGD